MKHECGIFGVFGHKDAAKLTYLGLYALQHRGEESAGIVATDGKSIRCHRGMGLVGDVFDQPILDQLSGHAAIGHVRYSTTGSSLLKNAQPILVDYRMGPLAVAHNGNLTNAKQLRRELEDAGSIFQTTVDSEIIVHLMARPNDGGMEESVKSALRKVRGAYSLLMMTENKLMAARDANGIRPLCLGRLEGAYVLASETCAFDLIDATYEREVRPGEVLVIGDNGTSNISVFSPDEVKPAHCIFEHIYFARPDSYVFGESVHLVREKLGQNLAKEHPVDADLVIPVPDSGNSAALGYSFQSGIRFESGFIRNHYVGRTFIHPVKQMRDFKVKVKLNPIKSTLSGKRVIVVDDSIVRGTTSRTRVKTLRAAGAKEVHIRVSCPPHRHPCFYGIDFPSRKELIASKHSIDEIAVHLNADSVKYQSLEGLLKSVSLPPSSYCAACLTGEYPVEAGEEADKLEFEKKRPLSG